MRYVAAFRTYTWNDSVADLAERFFASFPGGVHVVLADGTRGDLGIPDRHRVLWHGDDVSDLDVASYPEGKAHWYNVDYALYVLRREFPDADFYVTSESDLAVNLPLEYVLTHCRDGGIDAVVHGIEPSTPDWHWHDNAAAAFASPWRSMCFFMVMSARAVDALWATRRRHAAAFADGSLAVWPFCESFVPTVLKSEGMSVATIGSFAATEHLRYRPRLRVDDPRANAPGSMAHSVLPRETFFGTVVGEHPPQDWFTPGSELRVTLDGYPPGDYADLLRASFARARDHAGYSSFVREAAVADAGSPDLAYLKPALTSSTCEHSNFAQPWLDAGCANGSHAIPGVAFHTAREDSPWWMVDLMDEFVVDEIAVVNRPVNPEQFRRFTVQGSRDGTLWVTRYAKLDMDDVSSDPDSPFRKAFADPFVARYVRIVLVGEGILHLCRVGVFGRSVGKARSIQPALSSGLISTPSQPPRTWFPLRALLGRRLRGG